MMNTVLARSLAYMSICLKDFTIRIRLWNWPQFKNNESNTNN